MGFQQPPVSNFRKNSSIHRLIYCYLFHQFKYCENFRLPAVNEHSHGKNPPFSWYVLWKIRKIHCYVSLLGGYDLKAKIGPWSKMVHAWHFSFRPEGWGGTGTRTTTTTTPSSFSILIWNNNQKNMVITHIKQLNCESFNGQKGSLCGLAPWSPLHSLMNQQSQRRNGSPHHSLMQPLQPSSANRICNRI